MFIDEFGRNVITLASDDVPALLLNFGPSVVISLVVVLEVVVAEEVVVVGVILVALVICVDFFSVNIYGYS